MTQGSVALKNGKLAINGGRIAPRGGGSRSARSMMARIQEIELSFYGASPLIGRDPFSVDSLAFR
jgi:hypothetical protein